MQLQGVSATIAAAEFDDSGCMGTTCIVIIIMYCLQMLSK